MRSYSGQLPTWYFVLYFGWTRDLMLKIVFVPASERQEHRHCVPEEQHSRTNAPCKRLGARMGWWAVTG